MLGALLASLILVGFVIWAIYSSADKNKPRFFKKKGSKW